MTVYRVGFARSVAPCESLLYSDTVPGISEKRRGPFRFVRYLRLQDCRDGSIAPLRRCLPKLEAGNRGVDGWIYGDSRMLVGVVCDTISGWRTPRPISFSQDSISLLRSIDTANS